MSGDLRALIGEIDTAVQKVNENSQKLMVGTSEATSVSQQLLTTMMQVAAGADVQQNKVTGVHQIFESITEFSENVNQAVQRVTGHSKNSVDCAFAGEQAAQGVYAKIIKIREFMSISERTMNDLQILSKEIQGMVKTVKEVADQTNLLSLNASIEAARAGEAGRGFSVVASSIGDLAIQTKEATNQVTGLVKRVQKDFETLNEMIATENQEILEGENAVAGLEKIFETIISSAQKVNYELQDVTAYTHKLSQEHAEALSGIRQIAQIALEHKEGTIQVSNSVEQQFGFAQEIIGISQILTHWGDNLHASVGKFKKDIQHDGTLG
jgi:methyl-accepting chemotaxis protein